MAQTIGIIDCGVTLAIEETLALAVDEKSKFKDAINAYSMVVAYWLDSIKKKILLQN